MNKPTLKKAAENIVNYSLGLKSTDRFLVLTDEENKFRSEAIINEAKKITDKILVLVMEKYGKRPFVNLITDLVEDVSFFKPTAGVLHFSKEVGEETFRNDLIDDLLLGESKTRFCHMLAIPQDIFVNSVGKDYSEIHERGKELKEIVKNAKKIKVTSEIGTNLEVDLYDDGDWHIESGMYRAPGEWGNLPDGELEILPENANGEFAVAEFGSFFSTRYGIFEKDYPKLILKEGRVEDIVTNKDSLRKDLESFFCIDSNSNRIGEFAIGINTFVEKMTGFSVIDEKKVGVHIGLGSPHSVDDKGAFRCTTHLDCIGKGNTIFADGKKIMENDKLLFE